MTTHCLVKDGLIKVKGANNFTVKTIDWTPTEITTELWLDASDTSTITIADTATNEVVKWTDKSGNSRNAVQAYTGYRPIYDTDINGVNSLNFDGTKEMNGVFPYLSGGDWSVFCVTDVNTVAINQEFIRFSTNITVYFSTKDGFMGYTDPTTRNNTGGLPVSGAQIIAFKHELVNRATHYINGTQLGGVFGQTTFPVVEGQYKISWQANSLRGSIGELIVVHGDFSSDQRQKMEGYLAHKWNLTGSLPEDHPYKNAKPLS